MIKSKIRVGFLSSMATISIIASQISHVDAVKFHITPDEINVQKYAGASIKFRLVPTGLFSPTETTATHIDPTNRPWVFDFPEIHNIGIQGLTLVSDRTDKTQEAYLSEFFTITDDNVYMTLRKNILAFKK